ncbi:hypothetical protein ACO34A_07005 [Rhizobium sp. ACO-34A]|nr:hypothetical protein ACO34A_07005 [Rhizobium sp. ACO-34A]
MVHPPLACRPSPPQGGRSAERLASRPPDLSASLPENTSVKEGAGGVNSPISPLEGEMPGRAEGGIPECRLSR